MTIFFQYFLTANIDFGDLSPDDTRNEIARVENELEAKLESNAVGEYNGTNTNTYDLWMYGFSADEVIVAVELTLENSPFESLGYKVTPKCIDG